MTSDASPATAPTPVRQAYTLWMVAVVCTVLSPIIGLFGSEHEERLFDPGDDAGLIAVGVVALVVIGGLLALFTVKMRAGRNWARIVLLVLALLSLSGLRTVFGPAPDVIGIVVRVIDVAGIVAGLLGSGLTFLEAARPHFRRVATA